MNDTQVQKTDVTTSELILGLSKEGLAYQELLQECENIVFTNENLNEQRPKLQGIQKLESKIKGLENPHTAKWQAWNESRRSILEPVTELKNRKSAEFKKKADENSAAAAKAEAEKQRVAGIKSAIDTFFLEQSQAIAAAKTPEELVRIEKLIGSHKANSSRYQEFLPVMIAKAANLTELIKVQKEAIKILTALNRKEMASGDDAEILELREQQEQIQATLEQTKITVQEKAIGMATQADVVEAEVVVAEAPKARRTAFKWEIVDEKAAVKKGWAKNMVVQTDAGLIDNFLQQNKGSITDEAGFIEGGVRFFLQKSY